MRCSSTPRLQPHARGVLGSELAPETPAYDVQQACGTGLETAIAVANKIALGQIESGIAGGVDTTSDAPIARQRGPAPASCSTLNRAKSRRRRAEALDAACGRARSCRRSRATPSRAPACRWASTRRSWPRDWGVTREDAGRAGRAPATSTWPPPTSAASSTTWSRPTSGLERDQNLRPDSHASRSWPSSSRSSARATGTMTAGNSTPLTDGASAVLLASEEWARGARAARCWRTSSTRRPPPSTTCTGGEGLLMAPGLRDAAAARAQRADAAGLRPLRDPRGVRRAGAGDAEGVGGPGVLPERLGPRRAARRDRPRPSSTSTAARWPPATRSPRPAGGSSPRWPRRCDERGSGRGADHDLRRRRPGRRRDPGGESRA